LILDVAGQDTVRSVEVAACTDDSSSRPGAKDLRSMTDRHATDGWTIALDGGTTNTRARLLRAGRVVAVARRAVGVRDAALSGGPSPLAGAVRGCLREVADAAGGAAILTIAASGMLTAEVGLCPVPHVVAPTGLGELAAGVVVRRLPEAWDRPIAFVPGVRTPPGPDPEGWAEGDVMRGEECATLGAWEALGRPGAGAFVWPGSHTKLVEVDAAGRIVRSFTTLGGELTAAVARHTLIAASLPERWPTEPDAEALEFGARVARAHGLGRAAFAVRLAGLAGTLDPDRRAAFWIGAATADDVIHLANHPILAQGLPVWVGGEAPRRGLYARWLADLHPGPIVAMTEDLADAASALGAIAACQRADFS
jgi:2-dehydro-3-deoxygalactonokinase